MSIAVSILKYNMRAHKYNLIFLVDKTLLVFFFLVILINIVSYTTYIVSFISNNTILVQLFSQK